MPKLILMTVVFTAFGLLLGLAVAFLAMGMCGGGHGWCSACYSSASVLAAPLAALAWTLRYRRSGLISAAIAIAIAIVLDLLIFFVTLSEGTNYFIKIWNAAPLTVTVWCLLFVSWQIMALVVVLMGIRARHRRKEDSARPCQNSGR